MRDVGRALLSFFGCVALSCSTRPPTSLVLAIGSELSVPGEVDRLELRAERDGTTRHEQTYQLPHDATLPGTLTFEGDADDASKPLTLTVAAGKGAGAPRVVRKVRVGMTEQRSKLLRVTLQRRCVDLPCSGDFTCIDGACVSPEIDVGTLPEYVDATDAVAGLPREGGAGSGGAAGSAGSGGQAGVAGEAGAGGAIAGAAGNGGAGAGAGGTAGSAGSGATAGGGGASGSGGTAGNAGSGAIAGNSGGGAGGGGGTSGSGGAAGAPGGGGGAGGLAPGTYTLQPMPAGRQNSYASYLPTVGKALVCAGRDGTGAERTECWTYDPGKNQWDVAPTSLTSQCDEAQRLPDGRVVTSDEWGQTAAIFDPTIGVAGTWTATAPLTQQHYSFRLSAFGTKVLLSGGDGATATAELLDPAAGATGVWSMTAPMLRPRYNHAAVTLASGDVLAIGGSDQSTMHASVERFDGVAWTDIAQLTHARGQHDATLLKDGRVFVAGGFDQKGDLIGPTELFDPNTGKWTDGPSLNPPRRHTRPVLLPDGRVLMVGGMTTSGDTLATVTVYDPGVGPTGSLTEMSPMAEERDNAAVVVMPQGVLVAGGWSKSTGITTTSTLLIVP